MYRFVVFLTALTLAPLPAIQGRSQGQGTVPGGSYAETCQDITTNGAILQARCQKQDGDWHDTSLDYSRCRGQVINDDGNLRCETAGQGYAGLPGGDYTLTCHDIRTKGTLLQARCQKTDGSFHKTSIDYSQCGGQIMNDDGNLRCGARTGAYGHRGDNDEDDRGERQGAPPRGDYRRTCRNIHINGDKLEAECQEADGDWHGTSLDDFNRCRSEIVNKDGNLRCEK